MHSAQDLILLHLSDPQFGDHHRFGSSDSVDTLFTRLTDDLSHLRDESQLRPDFVVVSGDLAERGKPHEFREALEFLRRLAEFLELEVERFVLIPGNHDVNRRACELYFETCLDDEDEPVAPYWANWKHFASMFNDFYAGAATFTPDQPWTLFEIKDLKVVVAGLNSTIAESHTDGHWGEVGEAQYRWFVERLRSYSDRG